MPFKKVPKHKQIIFLNHVNVVQKKYQKLAELPGGRDPTVHRTEVVDAAQGKEPGKEVGSSKVVHVCIYCLEHREASDTTRTQSGAHQRAQITLRGSGFMVQGLGLRVQGLGLEVVAFCICCLETSYRFRV